MTKMKLLYIPFVAASLLATGCIEEIDPMTSVVTQDQLNKAPNSAEKLATGITSSMTGQFIYQPTSTDAFDYGYTSTILFVTLRAWTWATVTAAPTGTPPGNSAV